MLPKWHVLLGTIFLLVLIIFFNFSWQSSLIIFFASVLIDIDHNLFYILKFRDASLKKAYLWHVKLPHNHKPMMHLFHTAEFLLMILSLSFFSQIFQFVFLGMFFHSICDFLDLVFKKQASSREYFLLRFYFSSRKKYL